MSAPTPPADLLDLKMMPAWVSEPAQTQDYSAYKGEDERPFREQGRDGRRGGEQRARSPKPRERRDDRKHPEQRRPERLPESREPRETAVPLPVVTIYFLPHPKALESVTAQIKTGQLTYSVFSLARMFLDKPERYNVRVTAGEGALLHQLGENGPVAADRRLLESSAFTAARDDFYTAEVTQTEAVKGNFTNVARERSSGTLLGPTNHHAYQPQLRSLYEQRFSKRMSFANFQRQIEIVSDPAVVEQWKEQARSVTIYSTKAQETPETFKSLAEAERHFRQQHLPTLLRSSQEMTISGVISRRLADRSLGRAIEDAWSAEIRSPSQMMQELTSGLRSAGLNIFRHRRGMLFVSPVRLRPFNHASAGVSNSVNAILTKVGEMPGINRKNLAEQVAPFTEDAPEAERVKLTLASDLRWLISEGYLIEFNDGSLDLPRAKPVASQTQNAAKKSGELASSQDDEQTPSDSRALDPHQPTVTDNSAAAEIVADQQELVKPSAEGDTNGPAVTEEEIASPS